VTDYRPMFCCAAAGCERDLRGDRDTVLRRISPKGERKRFVGLCQDHYGKTVVLKPEASEVMEGAPA
jgi:hypothetical protein